MEDSKNDMPDVYFSPDGTTLTSSHEGKITVQHLTVTNEKIEQNQKIVDEIIRLYDMGIQLESHNKSRLINSHLALLENLVQDATGKYIKDL